MIIQDDHIRKAEDLLINGNRFDDEERIPFIKNLSSCDLLAVPGSGKTTALLAKLYCISKQLPFKDGSGILVLSHTNAAVDEIERNLKPYCPKLFEYPNFAGTIQSFVNKYLANPICFEKYGSYININDNDIYENEVKKFYYSLEWSRSGDEPKKLKNKLFGLVNAGQQVDFTEGCLKIMEFIKWFDFNINERKLIYNNRTILHYDSANRDYYLEVENWKIKQLSRGILNYYDSYNLGDLYVDSHPEIINILRKRFKFIFIDEMQDLEKFQIDIIDKIFFEENSPSIIQRIGDINQSIYSSGKKVKVESDWIPRNQMYLRGSNRLTQENSSIVNFFTLDRQTDEEGNQRFIVNGLRQLDNAIKPHIILYDNDSMGNLELKFKELIMSFSLQDTIEAKKYGFKIIGWNAKWDDDENHDGKLRLENIFETYKKEVNGIKETFDSLSNYIQFFNHDKTTLEAARKAVLNSLIHVLRIANKTYQTRIRGREVVRYYSKSEMINYIKSKGNNCDYELFKQKLYEWSFKLAVKKCFEEVYAEIKCFIENKFKDWFKFPINAEISTFTEEQFNPIIINEVEEENSESEDNQIKIDIGTVHSAKGKTHCATMYVETAYQRPTYDSSKVIKFDSNPFLHQEHKCNGKFDRQALKMMYVGFSRPTHLLCFAALKENIGNDLQPYIDAGWAIEDLTINN